MTMREFFDEAWNRYRASGDVRDGREAVQRAWDAADACWSAGDRESAVRWEQIAAGVLS